MIAAPLQFLVSPAAPEVPLADLGEGPCRDPDRQCLYWVGIPAGIVHQLACDAHATWQSMCWTTAPRPAPAATGAPSPNCRAAKPFLMAWRWTPTRR